MKFARYFLVGGTAAAVDLLVFVIFAKWLGLNYLLVSACGFAFATFVNYWLSIRFAFVSGVRFGKRQELALVYLISLVGLAIHQAVIYSAVDLLNVELVLSKISAIWIVFVWNYTGRAGFVFRASGRAG